MSQTIRHSLWVKQSDMSLNGHVCLLGTCSTSNSKIKYHWLKLKRKFHLVLSYRLFHPEDNYHSDHERERAFSATFTHTLYYLAQVNTALGHSETGGMYCHTTLRRQLETEQYDPVDWAVNCATLSQYYITQGNYMLARHCLGMYLLSLL